MRMRLVSSFLLCFSRTVGEIACLFAFAYDSISEFFYRREDISYSREVLDLRVAHANLDPVIVAVGVLLLAMLNNFLGQYHGINFFLDALHAVLDTGVMEYGSIGVIA